MPKNNKAVPVIASAIMDIPPRKGGTGKRQLSPLTKALTEMEVSQTNALTVSGVAMSRVWGHLGGVKKRHDGRIYTCRLLDDGSIGVWRTA
jgi:hypothetical protein